MANRGKIFDPRMVEQLIVSGYFPYTAQVEQAIEGRLPSGGITYSWAIIPGMDTIPCAEGALAAFRAGSELKGELVTELFDMQVALAGYYPDITPKMRVTVIELNHIWNILSVVWDPQGTYTELNVERTNPEAEAGT